EARARSEELLVLLEDDLAAVVDRGDAEARALLGAEELPRDDVRVVLEPGDDDLVARADVPPAVALRDQVDRLRRAAQEDDLAWGRGVQEAAHLLARGLVGIGGPPGERVRRAVDVRVLVLVEMLQTIDDRLGLLGRRAVVEPDQRAAVHLLLEDR